MPTRGVRAACRSAPLILALTLPASAQQITIRTVPVVQGDQFAIFPSLNLGMGGVSIALADTLLDPFRNPATGARLGVTRLVGSPALYNIVHGGGGGRTVPFGAFVTLGRWHGGAWFAHQQEDAGWRNWRFRDLQDNTNTFAFASLGRRLPGRGPSLAGSVQWSGLQAVHGVDLLYAGNAGIEQRGHSIDVRLGLLKDWEDGRSLEVVVLHDRYRMTHDVTYARETQPERNLDRTNTWGLHVEYQRPLGTAGWRLGWLATVNQMGHPKIPGYTIAETVPERAQLPRDPGESHAVNLGLGLARVRDGATLGLDFIYEPIWSDTWAVAAAPTTTAAGGTIPAGGKVIENRFRFSNGLLRIGASQVLGRGGPQAPGTVLQVGLFARAISYRLRQHDNVEVVGRKLRESWVEWTPTWGMTFRFPEFDMQYRGRITYGTGQPRIDGGDTPRGDNDGEPGSLLIAQTGPMTLADVLVAGHQVSISIPLR